MKKQKVVVGMSGGVDSSVAAYLLKEQGYEVIGVTMELIPSTNETASASCGTGDAIEDAKQVAKALSIPHYVVDFRDQFRLSVMNYFAKEYTEARTPNPCIMCNRNIKWEALLAYANTIGADYVATGHYAKIACLSNGRYVLQRSVTTRKDQTYALYLLTQEQLKHTLMPLGEYEKPEIREIARKAGLPVACKAESQDICFIPDGNYNAFLESYGGAKLPEGDFVNTQGEKLGRHKGLSHYTIGQRKGLGISFQEPLYVTALIPETNQVVLGTGDQVYGEELIAEEINWMAIDDLHEEREVMAKVRYNHAGSPGILTPISGGKVRCRFLSPVRAITPGQAVVFYEDDIVLGGGTII